MFVLQLALILNFEKPERASFFEFIIYQYASKIRLALSFLPPTDSRFQSLCVCVLDRMLCVRFPQEIFPEQFLMDLISDICVRLMITQ